MTRSAGATLKAAYLIAGLADDELYTAAAIARRDPSVVACLAKYERNRRSFGSFSRYHLGMHLEPDGYIGKTKAWFGRTWKEYVKPEDIRVTMPRNDAFAFARQRIFWLGCLAGATAATLGNALWGLV